MSGSLPDLLFPYLVGIVASLVLVLSTLAVFIFSGRRAVQFMKRESRLPEATRWEDLSARVQDLELEHDRMREDVFAAKHVIEEAERQQSRLTEIEDALRSKEQDYADLQRVQSEYAQVSEQLAADREETARLSAERSKAEFEREALREDSQRIETRVEEQKAEAKRLDERIEGLRSTEDEVRTSVDALRLESGQLGVQVAELTTRRDGLTSEITALEAKRDELKQSVDSLREDSAALATAKRDLDAECARLLEEIKRKTESLADQDARLKELEERLAAKSEDLNAIERDHSALANELKRLESERDALQQQVDSLQDSKRQVQELLEKEEQLKTRIAGLEESAKHKQKRLDELGEQVAVKDPASADAKHVLQELWVAPIKVDEFGGDADEALSEAESLGNVYQYLSGLGLRFPERVVNAFHTSLKCADDTPLLVLAGISGTGKSLLPRRYAEAMGIHFLSAPVQPRWDGPQDLLGFYNYLENRYKATELLRALLQFDPFDRSWVPDEFGDAFADQHMLLVLLDEMNLARVEYYFSEFLSRLETRRDVDRSNKADVRKAEIPIEVGRLASVADDDPVRVFVDSNVFFVGTINEDESTLSLSDKVVDRANIMRFGRPHDLANIPALVDGASEEFRAKSPMLRETWGDWVRAGRERPIGGQFEGLISDLNDGLELVGRPFGYRTRRAILTYLRMYPHQDDDGLRCALADQVEQRILPKLRGVDVTEQAGQSAVAAVADVVEKVGDQVLLEAIDRGRAQNSGHLFVWSGVDRPD